jgi:hypothetical protein
MRTSIAVVIFAAVVLAFFFDVIFQDRVLLTADPAGFPPWRAYAGDEALAGKNYRTDSVLTYLPRRVELSRSIAEGRLPLWNPYVQCGVPFFADPQARVLYPVALALVPFGAEKAMGYDVAVHFLLALTGMYLFLRIISASAAGSMLGAVAYGFSSFFFTRMGHPTFVASAAWLPFLFYGFEKARQQAGSGGRSGVILLAVFLALAYLAGFPQVLVFGVSALVVYALWLAVDGEGAGRRGAVGRTLVASRIVGIAGAISILAVGAHLVPFYEYLRNSVGLGIPFDEMCRLHISSPTTLARAVFPNIFGNPVDGTNWLPLVRPGTHPYNLGFLVYCGAGTLLLALAGLVYVRRSAHLRALFAILGAAVLIATSGIALRVVYAAVPLFRYSQIDRLSVVACFAVAALAGKTLSLALEPEAADARRRFALALLVAAVVLSASAGLILGGKGVISDLARKPVATLRAGLPPAGAEVVSRWVAGGRDEWVAYERGQVLRGVGFVAVSLLLAGACLVPGRRRLRAAAPWLLAAWVAVDLVVVARTYYVSQASPAVYETAGIRALREMASVDHWRVACDQAESPALPPNTNQIFELHALGGRSTMLPLAQRYLFGAAQATGAMSGGPSGYGVSPYSDLAAFLGTRYVLPADKASAPGDHDPRFQAVYQGDLLVYENRAALPRAVCVDRGAVTLSSASGGRPTGRDVVVGVSKHLALIPGMQCGRAGVTTYEPERIEIEVDADRDCYLLVADTHYPGWKARVDGREATILMTDVGTRALALGAGAHKIVMEFKPGSLTTGVILSFIGVLLGILYAAKSRFAGKR